jgi:signal transduction histidine kinase
MTLQVAPSSISRRLALMNLLVSASALLLASIGFLAYDQYTFRESLVRNLSAQAQIIGSNSASAITFNDPQAAENTLSALRSFPNITSAGIVLHDGHVFAYFPHQPAEHIVAVPTVPEGRSEVAVFRGDEVVLVRDIALQGKVLGTVFIRSSLSEISHRLSRYVLIAALVLLISLIAALLISSLYRRSVARPIVSLAETAKAVSEQKNYSLRSDAVPDGTEIGLLISSFNEMLQQIQTRDQALRDAQADLEQRVQERTQQLVVANRELEAFSYSVSHDLRGPLETINGFVHLLLSKYGPNLDEDGREYLRQVRGASRRMAELIDDLLNLSRVTTTAMHKQRVDMGALARQIMQDLRRREPSRQVEFVASECPSTDGDPRLMQIALENLLRNSWKYTSTRSRAKIEFGCENRATGIVYFVRDDGAGFDASQADRLFKPFQRLHSSSEFPGTGIGLATVQRIIQRHGGDVWAESKLGEGATFFFTVGPQPQTSQIIAKTG